MTTPASGQIALSDVNNEVGWGNPHQLGMDWVRAVGKTTPGGGVNVFSDFNNMHNKAWYSNNAWGANCNNGNCTSNCNCGNIQCNDCLISGTINCGNCDGGNYYLQPNCNCSPTFNCTTSQTSYNCNCNCDCFICACACW